MGLRERLAAAAQKVAAKADIAANDQLDKWEADGTLDRVADGVVAVRKKKDEAVAAGADLVERAPDIAREVGSAASVFGKQVLGALKGPKKP